MSTTLPPRGDDTPAGAPAAQLLPDEGALRHVFEDEFPGLLTEARNGLGDAAALAPKVVEQAFVHAWEQRARFENATGLRAFLHEEVHHGVARTLSRRAAAHRLGHHAPGDEHAATQLPAMAADAAAVAMTPAEIEAAWRHVVDTLHDHGPSVEARAHHADILRHDAAQHVAAIAKPRSIWKPVVAGIVGLVAIAFGMRWADRAGEQSAISRALAAADTRLASAGRGQQAVVTLAEGTRVKLYPDTRVTIPKEFDVDLRAVKLDGAATFEPKNGLAKPFQVHVKNAIVTATGTAFAVRGYEKDAMVALRVTEGTVSVAVGTATKAVAAGESLVILQDGTMRAPTAEEQKAALAWTDGRLVLANATLGDALPQLKRWFDLDIGTADPSLRTRPVSLDVPIDSPKEAIAAIEAQAKVKYSYGDTNRDLLFKDASATSPARK